MQIITSLVCDPSATTSKKIGKNNTKECRTFLAYFLDLYDCKEKDEGILAHS